MFFPNYEFLHLSMLECLSRPLAKLIDNVEVKVTFPNLPHASKLCFNFPISPRRSSAIEIERKYLVSIFSAQMDSLERNI